MPPTPSPSTALSIPRLRAELDGRVIAPGDDAYDQARAVFYRGYDRHPAVIIRATDPADVVRAVTLAGETGLELAVRSGGHSLAGHSTSEGGIVLDLAGLQALEIDAAGRTAWAQAGLTAGQYTKAVAEHGLATGFGDTGSVGIGGITLAGGIGYLVRKYGLTIDQLLAAEIVTADGQLLRVDSDNHPELFWALRGGGGNFGVVTRFQYRLHPVDQVVGGMLMLPATTDTIQGFAAAAEAAPEELSAIVNIMRAPPMPMIPAEWHGKLVMMGLIVYAGDAEAGQRTLAPFRALAEPLADMVRPMRYQEMFTMFEGPPPDLPPHEVARAGFLDRVDAATAAAVVEHMEAATAPVAVAQLRVLGGAMARVPAEATAFAHRSRPVMGSLGAVYHDHDETPQQLAWVTGFARDLYQGAPGAYSGFVGDEGPERVREVYPGATWERLVAVKRRYDPDNRFRLNHNIPPDTDGPAAT